MASLVNSTAAFRAFLNEIGLQALVHKFVEEGWETYGDLGFACSAPADPQKIQEEIIDVLIGVEPKPTGDGAKDEEAKQKWLALKKLVPRIRRAWSTANQLAASDATRLATNDQEPLVKLHPVERETRRKALADRITGFSLNGELDPSTRLVDRLSTILQTGLVKYVPWARCTSARAELLEQPEVQQLTLGPNGTLIKACESEGPACDVSTDLAMDSALRRRALAGEVAGLIGYDIMQVWHEMLKEALFDDPPPSYARVSYSQLVSADMELWKQVAARCRDGCKQLTSEGCTAFQSAWVSCMADVRLRLILQPLPRSGASSSSSGGAPVSHPSSIESKLLTRLNDLKNEMNTLKRKHESVRDGPSNKKGKGKGKGKRNVPRMPSELTGMHHRTSRNEPICFDFNMRKGCPHAPAGGKCKNGMHVCCKPGCYANHPVFEHPGGR